MNHRYIVVVALLALAIAAPAQAGYMWLDVNGDGVCTSADVLTPSVTSVDIYLATDEDANGTTVPCPYGPEPLTINSYTALLQASPAGSITFGSWTDNMGFANVVGAGISPSGNQIEVGAASGTILPAGTYKLGTLAITVTGSPTLQILPSLSSTEPFMGSAITSFGSSCLGLDLDNTMKYPQDWFDVCGTTSATPVTPTTWGKIKSMYK